MPDPEPCERCGAPVFLVIVHSKPMWEEVVCLCFARDHHRFQGECRPRTQHTPERCTAERVRRGGSTQPPRWTEPPRPIARDEGYFARMWADEIVRDPLPGPFNE